MTVRELINVFEKTKFKSMCETYLLGKVIDRESEWEFTLSSFGCSCYGGQFVDTILIEQNEKVIASFSSLYGLKENNEIMKKEVVEIKEIKISHYLNQSSSGNKYYSNSGHLTIKVK